MDSSPTGTRARSADIRHAAVVRCDIVGSTSLKRNLDVEGQLDLKEAWESLAAQAAERHGGHVESFEGDGAMIVFGHPDTREDMAEAAVRMGLELVHKVQSQQLLPNVTLNLRVGIATGKVAALAIPASAKSDSIAGITIDVAERLRVVAEPGQVVISDATRGLAGAFFEYVDLGRVQVKGIPEGVQAWRVLGATAIASRFEAQRSEHGTMQVLGRTEELSVLNVAWREAREGRGRAVCLEGPPGIGKSRLARAVLDTARGEDAVVLQMDCTPSTRYSPFFPVGVLLQRAAGITPSASAQEKRELAVRFLRRLWDADTAEGKLDDLEPLFGIDEAPHRAHRIPKELRLRTIEAVLHMLRQLAAERPVAMLCEDLHWVDDTTARVIERVSHDIARLPLLMIVTYRADEPDRTPIDVGEFTKLELQPLDAGTAEALVRTVAGDALSEGIVREVVARGEGVPLVLEELTRTLRSAGRDSAGEVTGLRSATERPTEMQLVVESRLARWPALRHAAQAASVLGREFSIDVLRDMLPGRPAREITQMLRTFTREGIFEPRAAPPDGRVRFRHVVIREAVHDTLLASDRQRLHSLAATTLAEGHGGSPDAAPDVLAEHLEQARRYVDSIRMRLTASAATAARGAYVESEGHCAAGLRLIGHVTDPAERKSLHACLLAELGIAQVGRLGYSAEAVKSTYLAAEEVIGPDAESQLLYPVKRALATFHLVRGNLAEAHALSAASLDIAQASNRVDYAIDALSVRSYTTLYFGALADCRTCIQQCLDLYEKTDGARFKYPVPQDAGTAARALLPTAAWLLGDAAGAERAILDGQAHVARLGRDYDRALMHAWIAGVRYTQRRFQAAIDAATQAQACAKDRYQEWELVAALMKALAQAALQHDEAALATADYLRRLLIGAEIKLNASYYLWGLAIGHLRANQPDQAAACVREAFERAEASGETRMRSELLMLEAALAADECRALSKLREATAVALEQGAVATALRAAATAVLRDPTRTAARGNAQRALAALDGIAAYPADPGWMADLVNELDPGGGAPLGAPSVDRGARALASRSRSPVRRP